MPREGNSQDVGWCPQLCRANPTFRLSFGSDCSRGPLPPGIPKCSRAAQNGAPYLSPTGDMLFHAALHADFNIRSGMERFPHRANEDSMTRATLELHCRA
eukprot:6015608-Pyramimonas_sp.AAC.1